MPKERSQPKFNLNLNLLRPQSNPEKIPVKLIHWLFASGRFIFVFVEALVLIAFIARFKLDADLAAKKEAIEEQIPYIESLKPYEVLIRQTQLKLSTIGSIRKNSLDFSLVFKKIADQTPINLKINSIDIKKDVGSANVHIVGQTQLSNDLTSFIAGLKEDGGFSNVTLTNVGLEQGLIKFTIDASIGLINERGKGV